MLQADQNACETVGDQLRTHPGASNTSTAPPLVGRPRRLRPALDQDVGALSAARAEGPLGGQIVRFLHDRLGGHEQPGGPKDMDELVAKPPLLVEDGSRRHGEAPAAPAKRVSLRMLRSEIDYILPEDAEEATKNKPEKAEKVPFSDCS